LKKSKSKLFLAACLLVLKILAVNLFRDPTAVILALKIYTKTSFLPKKSFQQPPVTSTVIK
jgi:hypothetical protein